MENKTFIIVYWDISQNKIANEVIKAVDYKTALTYALQNYINNYVNIIEIKPDVLQNIAGHKYARDPHSGIIK